MIGSAEKMAQALRAVEEAETPDERSEAAREFVKAERAHFKKMGMDVGGVPPWVERIIPPVLILFLVITLVLVLLFGKRVNNVAAETSYDIRLSQQQSCLRGNTPAENRVKALLLQAAQDRTLAELAPDQIGNTLNDYADQFEHLAADTVEAQQDVAAHPNAKKLAIRVRVACLAVYPLPEHRGDELPEPTLP